LKKMETLQDPALKKMILHLLICTFLFAVFLLTFYRSETIKKIKNVFHYFIHTKKTKK